MMHMICSQILHGLYFANIMAINKLKDWAATKLKTLHSMLKLVTSMLETKCVGESQCDDVDHYGHQ